MIITMTMKLITYVLKYKYDFNFSSKYEDSFWYVL